MSELRDNAAANDAAAAAVFARRILRTLLNRSFRQSEVGRRQMPKRPYQMYSLRRWDAKARIDPISRF
jgi:hypothetical protein